MLYTQAELLSTYLDAYALTGRDLYRQVSEELISFLKGTFAGPDGGFYASQDADAGPDDDGSYYTWSMAQLEAVLSGAEVDVLRRYYDIGAKGEMANAPRTKDAAQNVLWVAASPEQIARDLRKPVDEVKGLIESGRRKMIEARRQRPAPAIDRNILTDWNGMMVSSYLKAYEVLGDEDARAFALKTLDFILKRNFSATAGMFHSLLGNERLTPGLLSDQVITANALLDAYEITGDPKSFDPCTSDHDLDNRESLGPERRRVFRRAAESEGRRPARHSAQADSRHANDVRQCSRLAGAESPVLPHAGNTVSRLCESDDRIVRRTRT